VEEYVMIVSTTLKDSIANNVFHSFIAIPTKTFKVHTRASHAIAILLVHLMMEFVTRYPIVRRKQKQERVTVKRMSKEGVVMCARKDSGI
jgi:hypothetical protein